ncbi:lysozyme inhibitor LprI family protein, partial [Pseudomonas sp. CCOS 191]|uniref:lysozyme inhibitor LprI family protein n=1 Tax=Pseudomonas sp. CCOS 191 TaxID=1649877 RepID=UPI00062B7CB5
MLATAGLLLSTIGAAIAQTASSTTFDCGAKTINAMETLICNSQELSSQDRELARTYQAALVKAGGQADRLKAEQRGWIKGRDECWMKASGSIRGKQA